MKVDTDNEEIRQDPSKKPRRKKNDEIYQEARAASMPRSEIRPRFQQETRCKSNLRVAEETQFKQPA